MFSMVGSKPPEAEVTDKSAGGNAGTCLFQTLLLAAS